MELTSAIPSKPESAGHAGHCRHCALPVPERRSDGFCCSGCASVFNLIHEAGFEEFYRIRERAGVLRPAAPASASSARYGYLDDPAYFGGGIPGEMEFFLEGIHCTACVWLIEGLPAFEPSIESARVNLAKGVVRIKARDGAGFERAAEALHSFGYVPYPLRDRRDAESALRRENISWLKKIGVAGAGAGNIMILAVAIYAGLDGGIAEVFRWVSLFIALPVLTYSASPFYRGALGALRARRLSIDVPLALAIGVGGLMGVHDVIFSAREPYFDTLTMLVFLMLVSRYSLRRIQQRLLAPASASGFYQPRQASRIDPASGSVERVYSHRLVPGDRIKVAAGERLPADGALLRGMAWLDESLLTGESAPRRRSAGEVVYSGSLNLESSLIMEVSATGGNTRVGRILETVESNLASRSRSVDLADRIARVFVGVVVIGAAALYGGLAWAGHPESVSRALALVIVTCPCALALAAPLTLSLALARSARQGIWIRDADCVEAMSKVRKVYFDKTGTVTEGEYRVLRWTTLPGIKSAEVEAAVVAIEKRSLHPVARALVRELDGGGHAALAIEGLEVIPGKGVRARVSGTLWHIGPEETDWASENGGAPVTVISVSRDGRKVAEAWLGDRVRSESSRALEKLANEGYDCRLLSGDAAQPCRFVGRELGIPPVHVLSGRTPEDKERELRSAPGAAMVGDGANDAAALSAATVGIAVRGSMGASLRAAPVYLAGGISQLPRVFSVSRQAMRVLKLNAVLSLTYNLLGATGAVMGWISPLAAAVIMPMSSLTVLLVAYFGVNGGRS